MRPVFPSYCHNLEELCIFNSLLFGITFACKNVYSFLYMCFLCIINGNVLCYIVILAVIHHLSIIRRVLSLFLPWTLVHFSCDKHFVKFTPTQTMATDVDNPAAEKFGTSQMQH